MNVRRGDVVLVDYPYAVGGETKVRPALVIQNDRDNRRLANTIGQNLTSLARRAHMEHAVIRIPRPCAIRAN